VKYNNLINSGKSGCLTKVKTEVTLITIYGTVVLDHKGNASLMWQLDYDAANEYCDGNSFPYAVETFEGSNVHLEAINYGIL
jgi:hypothetical protein